MTNRHKRLTATIQKFDVVHNDNLDELRPSKIKNTDAIDHFTKAELNTLQAKDNLLIKRLNSKLMNHQWEWNILAIERDTNSEKEDYLSEIQSYCIENTIPTTDRITFAFNSSTGHHVSPWIVCHKIGHALLNPDEAVNMVQHSYRIYLGIKPTGQTISNPGQFFTFKSARDGSLTFASELFCELVAQYLIQGRVSLKRSLYQGADTEAFADYWNGWIKTTLDSYVGKTLVDYYDE